MSEDSIVEQCGEKLLTRQFGWIKFSDKKNCRACPGFVHPAGKDGISRAQAITRNGPLYIISTKYKYFQFDENIPDSEKDRQHVAALKKFNQKFKTSFV